ncbi:MAG: hypothetical protein IT577_18820 [Verrucomicrobiae bacterium]|nr:hypothetical protein [Verrucomicrobiae bacterium]
MSHAVRWSVRVIVALVLMALIASVAAALWLDRRLADPALGGEVAARLSEAIGAEVRIASLNFLWPGWIEIEGASVRLEDDPADRPMLEVGEIRLLISPGSLLERRVYCPIVQIVRPKLAFHLRADGSIALPRKLGRRATGDPGAGEVLALPARPAWPRSGEEWLAAIGRHSLTEATLMLFEADGSRSFLAEDVNLRGRFDLGGSGAGGTARLDAGRVILKNGASLSGLDGMLTVGRGMARLTEARAMIDGASVEGELFTDRTEGAPRFHFSAKVAHVTRRHLERFFDLPDYMTFGEADATVRGEGDIENPERVAASGALVCRDTRAAANQVLRLVGAGVTCDGWESIRFGDTTANVAYSNGWFQIEDIATDSPSADTSGSGRVAFGPAGRGEANLAGCLPLSGGKVDVAFRYGGDAASMPFAAKISLRRAHLREFLAPFDIRMGSNRRAPRLEAYLQGRVSGAAEFNGDLRAPGACGRGKASVDSLTVAVERLLQDLGVPADLPDVRAVAFGAVEGTLSVTNGSFRIEGLRGAGGNPHSRIEAGLESGPDGVGRALVALDLPVWKGRVNARLEQKPASANRRPFGVTLRGAELDAPSVLRSFRVDPVSLEGRATLDFSGGGDLGAPDRLQGAGSLAIRPARIQKVKTLNILASMIAMPGLGSFNLDSIETDYRIANRVVTLAEIRTAPKSRDHFTAQGTIGFDGATDLKGVLVVNSGAPGFVGNTLYAMGLKANRGFIQVPFAVTGKIGNPKVSISAPGLVGSAATTVIDHIPLLNRIPGLFRKREPRPSQPAPGTPPPGKR